MNFPKHNLSLSIQKTPTSAFTEIVVSNKKHKYEKKKFLIALFIVSLTYIAFISTFSRKYLGIHFAFIFLFSIILFRLTSLVDKEILKVVKNFGIEKSIVFAFNRKQQIFIPSNNIHKLVINEAIYFVSYANFIQILRLIQLVLEPHKLCPSIANCDRIV